MRSRLLFVSCFSRFETYVQLFRFCRHFLENRQTGGEERQIVSCVHLLQSALCKHIPSFRL